MPGALWLGYGSTTSGHRPLPGPVTAGPEGNATAGKKNWPSKRADP